MLWGGLTCLPNKMAEAKEGVVLILKQDYKFNEEKDMFWAK